MLDPSPEVIDERPQPAVSKVNRPQTQTRAPARAAFVADCLIAPRPDPSFGLFVAATCPNP